MRTKKISGKKYKLYKDIWDYPPGVSISTIQKEAKKLRKTGDYISVRVINEGNVWVTPNITRDNICIYVR